MSTIPYNTVGIHPDAFVGIDVADSDDITELQTDFDTKSFSGVAQGLVDSTHPFEGHQSFRSRSDTGFTRDIDPEDFTESRGIHIRYPVRFDPDVDFVLGHNIQLPGLGGGTVSPRFFPAGAPDLITAEPIEDDSWALLVGNIMFVCARAYSEIADTQFHWINLYAWYEDESESTDRLHAQFWWGSQRLFNVSVVVDRGDDGEGGWVPNTFNELDVEFSHVSTLDDPETNPYVEVGQIDWVKDEDEPNPYSGLLDVDGCLQAVGGAAGSLACPISHDALVFDAEIDPLAPIKNTMSWATDMLVSRNRTEQRRSIRRHPAQVLEFSVDAVSVEETSRIDALLQAGAPDGFRVPFWCDRIPLGAVLPEGSISIPLATAGFSFVAGEQAILWKSPREWEIVDVDSVETDSLELAYETINAWPVETLLVPIKRGYLPTPVNPSRLSRDGQSTALVFILCGWTIPA